MIDAVELSPDFAEARNALGILLLAEGRLEDAVTQFQWATASEPDRPWYHYHLALAWLAQGNVGFATPALNRAIELDPEMNDARRTLMESYIALGRWDRATQQLEALKRRQRPDARLFYAEGLIALAEERLDDAMLLFRRASAADERLAAPWAGRGMLFLGQGLLQEAEQSFRQALERAPDEPRIHLVLTDLYLQTGRYRLAETHLRQVMGRSAAQARLENEEIASGYWDLANARFQQGEYRTSRLYQQRAIRLLPELREQQIPIDAAAHFALGMLERARDNFDAAIREFELALRGDARFTLAWARYAEALLIKADFSPVEERETLLNRARQAAERAQDLEPRMALGYFIEGRVLRKLADLQQGIFRNGTLREANFAFQRARFASDAPPEIHIYQAAILSDLASYAQAASSMSEARSQLPPRFELPFLEATELIKAERFIEARAALTEAYLLDDRHPDLPAAMSLVLFRLGDVDGAAGALAWQPDNGQPLPGLVAEVLARTTQTSPAAGDETVDDAAPLDDLEEALPDEGAPER